FTYAGRSVAYQSSQAVLVAAFSIYDPYRPVVAPLGPAVDSHEKPYEGCVPLEDYLGTISSLKGFPGCRLDVKDLRNERIITGKFPFAYQPYDEPRLHELRRKYNLDAVIVGATDEWDTFVRLRNWTRSQFRRQDYQLLQDQDNFDALAILDR